MLGNFEKIFENFERISSKNCEKWIILGDFSQKLRKHALIFCGFGRKRQIIGNFEKGFENSEKISLENCENALF